MEEEDVYELLIDWFEETFEPAWSHPTHRKQLIRIHDDPKRKEAEADLCFGGKKSGKYKLSDIIHVKTRDNLNNSDNEQRKLVHKAKQTLNGSPKVWVAIEKSSYMLIKDDLDEKIGIIVYDEVGNKAHNFLIQKEAVEVDPKFLNLTNKNINRELGLELDNAPKFFVCTLDERSFQICVKERLWGISDNNPGGIGVIQRVRKGDYLLFQLTRPSRYVAAWIAVGKAAIFEIDENDPWHNPNHNYSWRMSMIPLVVEIFPKHVELIYNKGGQNEETKLFRKAYASGMLEIRRHQYDIIFKKLLDENGPLLWSNEMSEQQRERIATFQE